MPRRTARPQPDRTLELTTTIRDCPACGRRLWAANKPQRTVVTLQGLVRLRLQVRSCRNPGCSRHKVCLRPEQEGHYALPQHEFGLDVIALVGSLRHAEHRSVPEIHADLVRRGVPICPRSVGNLLDRYDELLALSTSDVGRLARITAAAGRVILAIDGLQPDVGHEVLWVIRDVLSGEVLLARSLLSSSQGDLAKLLGEVKGVLKVPIAGIVSDGQISIRKAVAEALEEVPHQLCHFHYLREAATPVYEADRHAKVQLKKKGPGHPADRAASRGAGRPRGRGDPGLLCGGPLGIDRRRPGASGGFGVEASRPTGEGRREPGPGGCKKGLPKELTRLRSILAKGLSATEASWPEVRAGFGWIHRAASILRNKKGLDAAGVGRRYAELIAELARRRATLGTLTEAFDHFVRVTRSYEPGLFRCYGVDGLPRTNNELEQFFGSYRYHERRCSGRKVACPGTVVRGSVRLPAAAATRRGPIEASDLIPSDLAAWKELRGRLGVCPSIAFGR